MTLPGSNAVLIAVEGPGALSRSGDPTGAGAAIWTGRATGFLDRREQVLEGDGAKALNEDRELRKREQTLTLYALDGAPLDIVGGPDATAETIVLEDLLTGTAVTRRWTISGHELNANGMDADYVSLIIDNPTPVS